MAKRKPVNTNPQMVRAARFCAIGERAINRTWMTSIDDAVNHAARLLANSDTEELFVVEIKRIVRRKASVDVITVIG